MNVYLFLKTLRDRFKSASAWSMVALVLVTIQLYIYPSVKESGEAMNEFLKAFPKELLAMFRIEDYTSAVGFLGTELYSMMLPLVFVAIGASWAAAAGALEEETGTAEITYVLPLSRTNIYLSKIAALFTFVVGAAVVLASFIWIGSSFVDLDVAQAHLMAATASCAAIGLFASGIAGCVAGLTGRRAVALGAAIGVSLLSFFVFALSPLVDSFDALLPFVPFEWALGETPLRNGWDVQGLMLLLCSAIALHVSAVVLLNRRDVKL